jgi:hypothetical protein
MYAGNYNSTISMCKNEFVHLSFVCLFVCVHVSVYICICFSARVSFYRNLYLSIYQCVLPVMTYGCETWIMNSRMLRKIQCTQRSMEICMLGITRRDRKRNTWVRSMTKVAHIHSRMCEKVAVDTVRRMDGRW